jgi:hypothetical protein
MTGIPKLREPTKLPQNHDGFVLKVISLPKSAGNQVLILLYGTASQGEPAQRMERAN